MALKKLSQIAAAGSAPALTDTVIGVSAGATDLQYTLTQIQATVLPNIITAGGPIGSATVVPILTWDAKGRLTVVSSATITQPAGANPTASVGLTAVNGSAATFMRSDGAPAYDPNAAFAFAGLAATVISAAASGAVPLTISGYSLTGSQSQSMVSWAGTLNTSGSPDVVKIAVTDTARGASTKLFNIYGGASGTTSEFSVDRSGNVTTAGAINTPNISNTLTVTFGGSSQGILGSGSNNLVFAGGNSNLTSFAGTAAFFFNSDTTSQLAVDVVQIGRITQNLFLTRAAAATLQLGAANAASPVAQTLQAQGSRAGTDSNVGGANLTVTAGNGTGTGTLSSLVLQSPVAAASGTGAQTQTTGLTIKNGTAVRASYTVATLPTASTVQGAMAFVTDANTTMTLGVGTTVVGSGANKVPVYSDGTNWIIG